jgi:hypothetical protein
VTGTCALCGGAYDGMGHNPQPLAEPPARCCDKCNADAVVPARIMRARVATHSWPQVGAPDPRPTFGQRAASKATAHQGDLPGAYHPGAEADSTHGGGPEGWQLAHQDDASPDPDADPTVRHQVRIPLDPADRERLSLSIPNDQAAELTPGTVAKVAAIGPNQGGRQAPLGSHFTVRLPDGRLNQLRGRTPTNPGPGRIVSAAQVPEFRSWLVRQWQPGGSFARAAQAMADTDRGRQLNKGGAEMLATDATVEVRTLNRAELYFVEPEMVDLLADVAPGCPPDVRPTDLVWPADEGLVVLAKPIEGTASDTGARIEVWAFTWSRTSLRSNLGNRGDADLAARYGPRVPCLSVASYRLVDFDKGLDADELALATVVAADTELPVTVQVPDDDSGRTVLSVHGAIWVPMGRSDWPEHDGLAEPVPWALDADMDTSIHEDRRTIAALFTCLAQQGIASQVAHQGPRPEARRQRRQGVTTAEPAKVLVVTLRRPRLAPHAPPAPPGATLRSHRWLVREHPRWQACGTGRKERRLVIVPAHIKGPPGAPLVVKQRVNRWVR